MNSRLQHSPRERPSRRTPNLYQFPRRGLPLPAPHRPGYKVLTQRGSTCIDIQYRRRHPCAMSSRAFRCPVCGGCTYRGVWAPLPDGRKKETFLHECAGCSVVFLDPIAFNANEPGPPRSRGAFKPLPPAGSPGYVAALNDMTPATAPAADPKTPSRQEP